MNTHADKQPVISSPPAQEHASRSEGVFQFRDERPGAVAQRRLQKLADTFSAQQPILQRKENDTGLPDHLKSGIENLSGIDMSDVKVHYNSAKPRELQAHAYAQGSEIHVAPGQEKHLPHEAWHVVQQKQGRVKPTRQLKGIGLNDSSALETEADVMGAKAVQLKSGPSAVPVSVAVATPVAQLTYDKGPGKKDRKKARNLTQLNAMLTAIGVTNLALADFAAGTTAEQLNQAITDDTNNVYHGIAREAVIAFYTAALATARAAAAPAATFTYDTHGDKHFPNGPDGTKFTAPRKKLGTLKKDVNTILEGIVKGVADRIKTDAAGTDKTYYYTSAGITQCPTGHDLVIQIDYKHATNSFTYHGYPDNSVTAYSLSRTKGGEAIAGG